MTFALVLRICIGVLIILILYESQKIIKHWKAKHKESVLEWTAYVDEVSQLAKKQDTGLVSMSFKEFLKEYRRFLTMGKDSIWYSEGSNALYRLTILEDGKPFMYDYLMQIPVGNYMRTKYIMINHPRDLILFKKFLDELFGDKQKCRNIAGRTVE